MNAGEDLVNEPFARLIAERQLIAYRHAGFWHAMDTFKDRQALEDRYSQGDTPWIVWPQPGTSSGRTGTGERPQVVES
jgi:glucose-1-phosphate cytidylyltransferase